MKQETALAVLKSGANVFLTGEPGSGKTYVVNQYAEYLRAHGIEPAITASTGIAATHIGGFTIHSWCGIGIKRHLTKDDLNAITQNKRLVGRVSSARVLIIDELSMLSADALSMINMVCCKIRRNEKPFGGLQAVLVGDFFQLPPVVSRKDYAQKTLMSEPKDPGALFAYASTVWQELRLLTCYITEQHRQDDAAYMDMLSAVRGGTFSEKHRILLRTRYAREPRGGTSQLYSLNIDVDHLNTAELAKLPGAEHAFLMKRQGPEQLVGPLTRGCLSPENLVLKANARVMFTKNDTQTHAYVNGTQGVVATFEKDTEYPIIKTESGKSVTAKPVEWRVEDRGRVLAEISQIPLRLAWAITIHKSQGMSLDTAHMNLADVFEYGQGYVALSRVRSLQGLTLAGLNERALLVHPDIQEKDKEFRNASREADRAFSALPAAEQAAKQENFIRACGGHAKPMVHSKKPFSVSTARQKHSNAYRPWNDAADAQLVRLHRQGVPIAALAGIFKRNRGAIRSRLAKLL
jgi:ATP-dependent DNA helicase PIF1